MPNVEAPRWRLTAAHHLSIDVLPDGTKVEWEHKETSRESGRAVRKLFAVPMFLEPKDAADHNYPGEIIVAHAVEGAHNLRQDYIFKGPPTQEMEPLNEAAEVLSEEWKHKWDNPIESLPANGGMTSAESAFMQKMMEAFERIAPPRANVPAPKSSELDELKVRFAKLEALMMAQNKPAAAGRRV
jgi:hypothetical protein